MSALSKATLDAIAAAVNAALDARAPIASAPVPASEASAHWKAKDLACPRKCGRTFRTAKGLAWHIANVKV